MLDEERLQEFRSLLDRYEVKSLFYSEADPRYDGVYYIISRDKSGKLIEEEIKVEE